MFQLVYISTKSASFAPADMDAILHASQRNNGAVGVTGMLLFNGRRFLQALEGEEAAIRKTYERIRYNPRHFALVELGARPIKQREFGEWAMANAQDAAGDFLGRVDMLTARASPVTRAHFMSYAALKAA